MAARSLLQTTLAFALCVGACPWQPEGETERLTVGYGPRSAFLADTLSADSGNFTGSHRRGGISHGDSIRDRSAPIGRYATGLVDYCEPCGATLKARFFPS